MNTIMKRLVVYIIGLFLLSLGVGFSIQANLGVSPVSSLPYALSLITSLSVGTMTFVANLLFIACQLAFGSKLTKKDIFIQLIVSVLFGIFMDSALALITIILPMPQSIIMRLLYLVISLFIIAFALLLYFTAQLPLMSYDALTYAISKRFKLAFGKAKITGDLVNVAFSATLCLLFIHSFGSIGIGTFIAAYFIGKIVGVVMTMYQPRLKRWIYGVEAFED